MNLHTLKSTEGARHRRKRLGRGEASGRGKTAGRGNKGYHARAGSGVFPLFEGGQMPLIRRLPKRGFTSPCPVEYAPVNVGDLETFDAGAEITPVDLRRAGLARGPVRKVKILGGGAVSKKLTVKAHAFSAAARSKIEAAGGACEILKR